VRSHLVARYVERNFVCPARHVMQSIQQRRGRLIVPAAAAVAGGTAACHEPTDMLLALCARPDWSIGCSGCSCDLARLTLLLTPL